MKIIATTSTKGGVGKTTVTANLGAILADTGKRVLLVDLDIQPTLSSYYPLTYEAPAGVYEFVGQNEQRIERVVSRTNVPNLSIITSNDPTGQLTQLLLTAPDGRLRLRNLLQLPQFQSNFDAVIIDTQGARSVLLEMSVMAANLAISPVTPEILSARELRRGTMQLFKDLEPYRLLGITLPRLQLLINRADYTSTDARMVTQGMRTAFADDPGVSILHTAIPALATYRRAATLATPVHRIELKRPSGRRAPAAFETMRDLADELFPDWNIGEFQPDQCPTETVSIEGEHGE